MTDLITEIEASSEFDAVTKLRPGEPHFMLIGRDRLAPPLVQQWADDNRLRALKEFSEGKINAEKRDRELEKSTQAEAIGWAMTAFKAGDMAKRVLNEPTVKTYTGAEVPEETKRRDRIQSLRISAKAALNEAAAACDELVEFMREGELDEEQAALVADLVDTVGYMRASVEDVTPKRPVGASA